VIETQLAQDEAQSQCSNQTNNDADDDPQGIFPSTRLHPSTRAGRVGPLGLSTSPRVAGQSSPRSVLSSDYPSSTMDGWSALAQLHQLLQTQAASQSPMNPDRFNPSDSSISATAAH